MRLIAGVLVVLASMQDGDWVALFDGKSLDGWEQKNGTATYRVEDGCVVGKTAEGSPNSFLATKKSYGDFELKFEVKVDDELNSGVQIRSASKPDYKDGQVHGPQVEIATNGTAGFIYAEGLKFGWLSEDRSNAAAQAAFKKGDWNRYRVVADGKSIKTWVNDVPVADLVDEKTGMLSGFIGLQVQFVDGYKLPHGRIWCHRLTARDGCASEQHHNGTTECSHVCSLRRLRTTLAPHQSAMAADPNDVFGECVAAIAWPSMRLLRVIQGVEQVLTHSRNGIGRTTAACS